MNLSSLAAEDREKLANTQHKIWSHWMRHLFSVCVLNQDGSYTIPRSEAERWERQAETPYEDLAEDEKNSDREQADRILEVLRKND